MRKIHVGESKNTSYLEGGGKDLIYFSGFQEKGNVGKGKSASPSNEGESSFRSTVGQVKKIGGEREHNLSEEEMRDS